MGYISIQYHARFIVVSKIHTKSLYTNCFILSFQRLFFIFFCFLSVCVIFLHPQLIRYRFIWVWTLCLERIESWLVVFIVESAYIPIVVRFFHFLVITCLRFFIRVLTWTIVRQAKLTRRHRQSSTERNTDILAKTNRSFPKQNYFAFGN